jgi:uncharacterized protein
VGEGSVEPGVVCARCPKALGRSCCELAPGSDQKLATLTTADMLRIRDHIRRSVDAFAEVEWLSEEAAREYTKVWPLYDGYFRHGPARWTLRAMNGACVFHSASTGCRLPAQVRPVACKLYPFSPTFVEDSPAVQPVTGDEHGRCLAVEEAASTDEVMKAFGLTPETLDALKQTLREDVRTHGTKDVSGPSSP